MVLRDWGSCSCFRFSALSWIFTVKSIFCFMSIDIEFISVVWHDAQAFAAALDGKKVCLVCALWLYCQVSFSKFRSSQRWKALKGPSHILCTMWGFFNYHLFFEKSFPILNLMPTTLHSFLTPILLFFNSICILGTSFYLILPTCNFFYFCFILVYSSFF